MEIVVIINNGQSLGIDMHHGSQPHKWTAGLHLSIDT